MSYEIRATSEMSDASRLYLNYIASESIIGGVKHLTGILAWSSTNLDPPIYSFTFTFHFAHTIIPKVIILSQENFNMPRVNQKISYRKCDRCRRDRQKV